MIRYTNDVPPRVDRSDEAVWWGKSCADVDCEDQSCHMNRLADEIDRLQRELAEARAILVAKADAAHFDQYGEHKDKP